MSNVHLINHPLVQHKLTLMRRKDASTNTFRTLLNELSSLMAYEVTRDMPLQDIEVETPLETMTGKVIEGAKLGRTLGYPTANLRLHRRATPVAGVFAVRVSGCGLNRVAGVASLGTRPAVNGKELLLEAHIFDFSADLYRRYLHVDFIERLRDELWFPDVDTLVGQIHRDAARAREILAYIDEPLTIH